MAGEWSPQAPDWWRASDGLWYPPEARADRQPTRDQIGAAEAAPLPEPEAMTADELAAELSAFDPASSPRFERPAATPVPRAPAPPPPAPRPRPPSGGMPPPQLPKRKNLFIPIISAIAIMVIAFAVAILAAA